MTGLRRRANRFVRFCPILTPIFDHLLPGTYAFKLVNDDSEKLQKILKFLHNTPHQGLLEGLEQLLGAHRGFKEALFSTLISADFLQNLPKFCSEDTRREPEDLWIPLRKSSENPSFTLSLTSRQPKHPKNISENFQYFLGRLYKVHKQAPPTKTCKKAHGGSCGRFCGGFRDTSLMNPAVHLSAASFSEARPDFALPPQPSFIEHPRSPKNVPCKATTRQDAPK